MILTTKLFNAARIPFVVCNSPCRELPWEVCIFYCEVVAVGAAQWPGAPDSQFHCTHRVAIILWQIAVWLALHRLRGLGTTALPEIPLDHVLACEKDAAKQAWISELPSLQRAACISDITAFGVGARARDWRSGVVVDLDMELHLLDAGFSCKDLSNLNVDGEYLRVWVKGALGKVERDSMQLPARIEERGTTIPTLLGVLSCIIQSRPWFAFLEHVSAAFELRDDIFTPMAFTGHTPLVMNSALLTCFGLYSVPVLDVSWSTSIIEELTS